MDAFYASVELRRRPELRGKPVVVCGSGPRAVVTTASYEARRLAGIHSAMPAAVARRRLPDAVYLRPDFTAYREASGEVMAILRRNAETVEVVGLDEAYVDLTGIFSPKATMRRIAAEIREETGLDLLGRDLREPHAGEDHQRAGQARRPRRPLASRSAGAIRRGLPRPGSRDRAEDGRHGSSAMGIRTLAELRRARRGRAASRPSGRARAPGCTAAPGFEDETPLTRRPRDEVAIDRDHLRRRRRRPRRAGGLARRSWRRSSAAGCAKRDLRGPHDRDQGPPRRLDQRHPLAHGRASRPTTRRWSAAVALELLRAYSPPRPVRLLGVRVAQFGDGEPPRTTTRRRSCD